MAEPSILIVDDEREVVDAMVRTLRRQGYRFFEATSAEEALAIVDSHVVDVVVSDIDMPAMSGLDLLARVRKTHPRIKGIIVTGVATLDSALRAINESGVHRFLTKPWNADELRAAIRDSIELRTDPHANLANQVETLSPRLRETLRELMTGAPQKEIADRLGLSFHTVNQYVKAIYRAFEVRSRPELMAKIQTSSIAPVAS